jgi:Ras-related C3 botulinum toxin substrate 1
MYNEQAINLQLWDTAGQEDYKKLRPLSYPQTDVFIIAFSLTDPVTLENVENAWVHEIKEHCPNTPYILVGLKSDLRDNPLDGMTPVSKSKGEEMMKKIGGFDYVECSSYKAINLKEVFEAAIKIALNPLAIKQPNENIASTSGGCCEVI